MLLWGGYFTNIGVFIGATTPLQRSQKKLFRLLRDYPHSSQEKINWDGKFLLWARQISKNHASHITPGHIEQLHQLLLNKDVSPSHLRSMCEGASWPSHASSKLLPSSQKLRNLHKTYIKTATSKQRSWDLWGVPQPHYAVNLTEHLRLYFNCITHIWEKAPPDKKEKVLRDFFDGQASWVFEGVFDINDPVQDTALLMLNMGRKTPWWPSVSDAFWGGFEKSLCNVTFLAHISGHHTGGNKGRSLVDFLRSPEIQDVFKALPPTTKQARGVLLILSHVMDYSILPSDDETDVHADWGPKENTIASRAVDSIGKVRSVIKTLASQQNLTEQLSGYSPKKSSRKF